MTELELYFQYRCEKGLKKRNLADKPEYQERLKYEIGIITSMQYCGYFLIVSDLLTWALANGIPVGPGRGSAAGALVAYVLEITHLDPIKYGLIFERFLNPDRVSMPDIDMDFCEDKRIEVIEYVAQKYGVDKVAHIGTYGSMKAKASIRAVANALGLPYALGDKLAKMTLEPVAGKPVPLKTCYEKVPGLNQLRHGADSDSKEVLRWAEKIENRLRSFGTHASGIVIAAEPVATKIPLYTGKDGKPTTQFEMNTVEECGLIKFDFLGLRALTTIDRCVKMVSEKYGIDINPLDVPVDDEEVFKQIQTGDVTGVFQLEGSSGMRDLVVRIKPSKLEDLSLLVAIYRPGPLESAMLQHYLKVREGKATAQYIIPELEPILNETDGMLIYQEQILEICKQLAGYSLSEADLMRRAVGKKKKKEMDAQHEKFTQGMVNNGIKSQMAEKVWQEIESFASYGFNKAHSACYAYIGYQMAYLKTHYPLEFMCSCLISDSDETDKVIKYISYCKTHGIKILPPSINESKYNFSVANDGKSIRFGLSAIKNLGKPVKEIIEERKAHGPYKDFLDFAHRVNLSKINKRKLESLVLSGAFDDLGGHTRASLMAAVEDVLRYKEDHKRHENKQTTYEKKCAAWSKRQLEIAEWNAYTKEERKKAQAEGKKKPGKVRQPIAPEQPSPPQIPKLNEMDVTTILMHEKELMGFFVTGHPLDNIKESMPFNIALIKEMVQEEKLKAKAKISLIAIPNVIKEITTKQAKQKMAYVVLEDKTGTIQAVALPKPYELGKDIIDIQTPARYDVEVQITEGDLENVIKLMITRVSMLPSVVAYRNRPLNIIIPTESLHKAVEVISKEKGDNFNLILSTRTKDNSVLSLGTFRCRGNQNDLEKSLKEFV